jgi:hypothetical protein
MRRSVLLVATLCLVGCHTGQPLPVVPAAQEPQATPSAPAAELTPMPAATPAAAAATGNLSGRVLFGGQPVAGGTVSATLLGETSVLATGATAADGTFALTVSGAPVGALLKLTTVKDGLVLGVLTTVPAARSVAADESLGMTESTSLALRLLSRRFEAGGIASRTAGSGQVLPTAVAQTLAAFRALELACRQAIAALEPGARERLAAALGTDADGPLPAGLAASPALADAFQEAASALATAIHSAYSQGGKLPPVDTRESVSFGGRHASAISFGGSGGGSYTPPTVEAGGGLTITPGDVVDAGGPVTGVLQ